MDLNKDVKYIKGVGPNRVVLLNKLGIYTLKDLITYYPRAYEDRSKAKNIAECIHGEEALIEAIVCSRLADIRLKGKTMQKLQVRDETGAATITWFNQSYLKNKFNIGEKYKFYGKITNNFGKITMNSPIFDDEKGVMNLSVLDTKGSILSISQFTLYADTKKGNRPSYIQALNGNDATKLYDLFNQELEEYVPVQKGIFGADMKISFTNDGPVTIILER